MNTLRAGEMNTMQAEEEEEAAEAAKRLAAKGHRRRCELGCGAIGYWNVL